MSRRAFLTGAVGAVTAIALAAGIAWSAIPAADGSIQSCYTKVGGVLRVIDTAKGQRCTSLELPLSWGQVGPRGQQGDPGPPGPPGRDGADGTTGLAGQTCTGDDAVTGFDGDGDIVCGSRSGSPPPPPSPSDSDGDGVADSSDCAPHDPAVYQGATELPDAKDNDCDNVYEDGSFVTCGVSTRYTIWELSNQNWNWVCIVTQIAADVDGDGFTAFAPIGSVPDCDDTNALRNPNAVEIANGADDDCDGAVDEIEP